MAGILMPMFTDSRFPVRKVIPAVRPAAEDREWSCTAAHVASAG
jgi:hypothetical protein